MAYIRVEDSKQDYSLSSVEIAKGYDEINTVFCVEDDESQRALDKVKSILKPINIFLVMIGWRPISVAPYKKNKYMLAKVWNYVWPVVVFCLLASTVLLQILSCDKRVDFENQSNDRDKLQNCLKNLVSYYIFPAGLILVSYTYMLYLIRREHSEHFANIMERVFLLYTQKRGRLSQSTLKRTVAIFFLMSICWLIFSSLLLILRSILNITYKTTDLKSILNNETGTQPLQILTIVVEPIPIALYDLFYVSQLLSYSLQAQLLIYYFNGLYNRIKFNEVKLQDAIQEIGHASEALGQLNGKIAFSVSLVIINVTMGLANTIHQLLNSVHAEPIRAMLVIYGLLSSLRWIMILYVPLIQAMLITIGTKRVMHVGLILKTRPYGYAETSQEELNYFQLYTSHLQLRGKLFAIPIYPWVVSLIVLGQLSALLLWLNIDPDIHALYWL
ncbi:hypothetical protein LOD99_4367 [Oopsacas minuta]|uniref:Gustatory receptor n=1 Tax=Oopsacas minuta TaxID=111878 RepID=A0AAV7JUU2_9METZ|nr:hypothetical protein LOD99_4367 [Oopsacas minuta]